MSSRPPVFSWNEELHFGPPSELISIQAFVEEAQDLHARGLSPWSESSESTTGTEPLHTIVGWEEWKSLSEEARHSIEEDCDLEDVKSHLSTTLMSQKRVSYLQKVHATTVSEISGRKKKEKPKTASEKQKDPDFESFKGTIEQTQLKMWKLRSASKPYIRSGHVSDQNALDTLQLRNTHLPDNTSPLSHGVLITFTAYTKNTWYPHAFSRNAQHALTSSNKLADIWSCIPCPLRGDGNMPREVTEADSQSDSFDLRPAQSIERVVGYAPGDGDLDQDHVVIAIEGVAYSDGHGSPDYADKLISHLEAFKPPPPNPDALPPLPPGPYERPPRSAPLTKGLPIDTVLLHLMTLRINEPYWMLHRGSCEHWFVIDEIRLQNPRDPTSGYPIGLQRTPTSRPLCRICSRAPATLSVLNDVRLGESPGMVCHPCWELFGGPPQLTEGDDPASRVVVVPVVFETS